LVEIKALSATSFAMANAVDGCFRLSIDTINGQHKQCDFLLQQDSSNQPLTGPIDQTVQLFVPADIMERNESLENFAMITLGVDQPSVTRPTPTTDAKGNPQTPPRGTTGKDRDSGKLDKKDSSKRLSMSFGPSASFNTMGAGSGMNPSNSSLMTENRLKRMNGPMIKLGQTSLFAGRDLKGEQEFQLQFDKQSLRLKVHLKQFTFSNVSLSSAIPEIYCLCYLTDREEVPLTAACLPVITNVPGAPSTPSTTTSTDPSPHKRKSTVGNTTNTNSSCIFRSTVTHKKLHYSWNSESFDIDSKSVPLLDFASYLFLEVWMKASSGTGGEDVVIGESLMPINPYKFSNPTELDCLIHPMTETIENEKLANLLQSNVSSVYGLGHLQISLCTSFFTDLSAVGGASPMTTPSGRVASRIRSSNLVKLSMSMKPIQPTDCAWPGHILSRSEKTIAPTIFYFGVAQDGIHIQADTSSSSSSSSSSADKSSILEECKEKVYSATGGLHLVIKYENIRLDDIFILNDSTLLMGIQFKRKMGGAAPGATAPSTGKAVYRDIRFEFLVGPCLAEDIYVTIANKVTLHPLRHQLCQHVSTSEKETEESFYSIAKLFQDSIYETITNISAAVNDLKTLNNSDSFSEPPQTTRNASNESELVSASSNSSPTKRGVTSPLRRHNDAIEDEEDHPGREISVDEEQQARVAEREKLLLREQEMKKRLNEVDEWNKLLPRLLSTHSSTASLSNSSNTCALKLLYLKKATLMIYLWYLIEQSPVHISADKHYVEASWILFDEIGNHVNSSLMNTEDLDSLLFRISDIMRNLEKEVRYMVLKAFRITNKSNDISLELSKAVYEKYITIASMLLGTLEYSELGFKASDSSKAPTNQFATPKSYVISNPQKKRDLIKFIIINDNMFEEYCNAILKSHHYEFNKRPLLSLCINFDKLLEKFSTILDQNLLMWNNRIIKYFMNTRGDNDETVSSPSTKTVNDNDMLLLTSTRGHEKYSEKDTPSSSSATTTNTTVSKKKSDNSNSIFFLPWDIATLHEKETGNELFVSNIPETIQLQLNVEIGLKKIKPMHLQEQNSDTNPDNVLDQDEESLYRIDLMNNKIAQAIARSYITLASEYEKVLLSGLIQNPDSFLTSLHARNIATRSSILMDSSSNLGTQKNYADDIDEKEEIMFFLLSMINDSYRIMHTHIPYSMQLFMNDYHRNRSLKRRKGNRRNSMRDSFISMRDSLTSSNNRDENGNDYESMNLITFKTSLKAMTAISRKAINDLTNQIFFHCELRTYFIAGWDEFFGVKQAIPTAPAATNTTTRASMTNPGVPAHSKSQKIISFLTTGHLNPASSQLVDHLADEGFNQESHSNVEVILATLSEFFGFIRHHVSPSDLEKIFYLCMEKLLMRYLLFIRDFHLYAEMMKKKIKQKPQPATPNSAQGGSSKKESTPIMKRGSSSFSVDPGSLPLPPTDEDFAVVKPILTRDYRFNNEESTQEEKDVSSSSVMNESSTGVGGGSSSGQQRPLSNEDSMTRPSLMEGGTSGRASMSMRGSIMGGTGRRSWFSSNNPFANTEENYERIIFKMWSKDTSRLMKFYSEMKEKLLNTASNNLYNNLKTGKKSANNDNNTSLDEFEDLTLQKRQSTGRDSFEKDEDNINKNNSNNTNNYNDRNGEELFDDEKDSPYKQTLTLLLNFMTHCIALSVTEDYPGDNLINEFLLNGFGITVRPSPFFLSFLYSIDLLFLFPFHFQ
jgi:hypothetical protein